VASRLSEAEKALIEELWSLGLPERAIGREVGRPHSTVRGYVKVLCRPAPAPKSRSPLRLSLAEREATTWAKSMSLTAVSRPGMP
jgi:hypothetical protein